MATGSEQAHQPARREEHPPELPAGEVRVGTGRISVARRVTPVLPTLPFRTSELVRLDDALAAANRRTCLHVSVYLGDLGPDTRTRAEELLNSTGELAERAVLVAVSPGQRVVEVVTGSEARQRFTDRDCKLVVMSMVAAFEQGDLAGGLIDGLQMLADQASRS